MGKNSKIEWCHHTFNPWWGCVKVSEGCKNCYAEARQYGHDVWGVDKPRRFFGDKHWKQLVKWNEQAKQTRERHRVFCGSYCDVFEDREDLWPHQERVFKLIHQTPHLDWLLLTKRPENIKKLWDKMFTDGDIQVLSMYNLDNVWLGVSAENQEMADKRIPELLKIPAKVRFLSCEPLLDKVLLDNGESSWLTCNGENRAGIEGIHICCVSQDIFGECFHGIGWVIAGGESGKNRRSMNLAWARSLRDQCQKADVPFFMKQIDKIQPIPEDLMIREFPS